MTASSPAAQPVTVFGGTGFLGRRIVRQLRDAGFAVRIASRHPDRGRSLFPDGYPGIASIRGDVHEEGGVAAALAGSFAVVNAISLYVERGKDTFRSVHVEAAARVARLAAAAGVKRLLHVSGIGADPRSPSPYIRSRGEGEAVVLRGFPSTILIRPSVMFGPDDALLSPLLSMMRRLPVFPLFGRGDTKLQPVYVDDVAEAIARILPLPAPEPIYELAGPQLYTYRSLLRAIGAGVRKQPILFPVPLALWKVIGSIGELLPTPPITRNQVDLLELDNVASIGLAGFGNLQIVPRSLEELLSQISGSHIRAIP
ncbi:MAG TPA: complex I NDUFA9 subunit family protein [Stellaceae bacterium]